MDENPPREEVKRFSSTATTNSPSEVIGGVLIMLTGVSRARKSGRTGWATDRHPFHTEVLTHGNR